MYSSCSRIHACEPDEYRYNPAMNDRTLSPIDRLLSGIGDALASSSKKTRAAREYPADDVAEAEMTASERQHAAGLMRVNHAGEVAAQGLYQGHAVVSRDPAVRAQLEAAAAEELDHLGWCEQRLDELDAKPSALGPLWYSGALAIGALSGVFGDRWALGFVEETERQVADHLAGHLQKLPSADDRSRAIVRQMRAEEEQHGADAKSAGAAELPPPVREMMRVSARIMTRTAYRM